MDQFRNKYYKYILIGALILSIVLCIYLMHDADNEMDRDLVLEFTNENPFSQEVYNVENARGEGQCFYRSKSFGENEKLLVQQNFNSELLEKSNSSFISVKDYYPKVFQDLLIDLRGQTNYSGEYTLDIGASFFNEETGIYTSTLYIGSNINWEDLNSYEKTVLINEILSGYRNFIENEDLKQFSELHLLGVDCQGSSYKRDLFNFEYNLETEEYKLYMDWPQNGNSDTL